MFRKLLCLIGLHSMVCDESFLTTSKVHCSVCQRKYIDSVFGLYEES